MPNPYGNLAGVSDPEDPNWRENAVRRVQEHARKYSAVKRQGRRRAQVQAFFDPPFLTSLQIAAKMRGMSVGSYVRRSIARQIARDLGIDWTLLLRYCAKPTGYDERGRPAKGSYDDGTGFGDWAN